MTAARPYPPPGFVLVPVEPTPAMIAAAAVNVLPTPTAADFELARAAGKLVLSDPRCPAGVSAEGLAAAMATIIPAHRAMLAAAPDAQAIAQPPEAAQPDLSKLPANIDTSAECVDAVPPEAAPAPIPQGEDARDAIKLLHALEDVNSELRFDRAMIADALKKLIAAPHDAETQAYAKLALGAGDAQI